MLSGRGSVVKTLHATHQKVSAPPRAIRGAQHSFDETITHPQAFAARPVNPKCNSNAMPSSPLALAIIQLTRFVKDDPATLVEHITRTAKSATREREYGWGERVAHVWRRRCVLGEEQGGGGGGGSVG